MVFVMMVNLPYDPRKSVLWSEIRAQVSLQELRAEGLQLYAHGALQGERVGDHLLKSNAETSKQANKHKTSKPTSKQARKTSKQPQN